MIDKFTFYKNYFEILKYLPDKDRLKMYDAILNYMFENKEPELNGLLQGIWINIKMPLDTNKKNINNGIKGGRPKNNNQDKTQTTTQIKPKCEPKVKANNISYFLFLISNNKYKYIYKDNNIYNSDTTEEYESVASIADYIWSYSPEDRAEIAREINNGEISIKCK